MALLPPDPVYTIRNVDNTPVYSLAFSFLPGGLERLLVGSKNGFVYAYNLQTNRLQQKMEIGKEPILHLVHTDYYLIAQEKGGTYTIWFLTEKGYQKQVTFNTDYPGFCRFAFNKFLEIIYVPISDSIVQFYNIKGENLGSYQPDSLEKLGDTMCLQYVNYNNDKQFLLVGYEIGLLYLWDIETGKCISKLETKPCPLSVDFHIGQQRGMCSNTTDCIQIFSITKTDFQLEHKSFITIKNAGVNKVQSRIDGKVFASAGWDGHIRIFSWFSLRPLAVLTEHKKAVQDIVYSSQPVSFWKNNIMAAGGLDGAITLWSLYNQKN